MNIGTAVLGLALTSALCAPAYAQTPAPGSAAATEAQHAAMTAEAVNRAAIQPHVYYGTIVSLNLPRFKLRLRNGHDLTVDASSAIKSDSYSAPLFAGKFVAVSGKLDAKGVFDAVSVSRFTSIDASTPKDH